MTFQADGRQPILLHPLAPSCVQKSNVFNTRTHVRTHARTFFTGIPLLLALLFFPAGCNIAKIFAFIAPDPMEDPDYTLPKDARLLIMLDERDVTLANPRAKTDYVESLADILKEHKVAAQFVPAKELAFLEQNDPNYFHYSIRDIGRKCGATVVLYNELKRFSLKNRSTDPTWEGAFQVAVKVIDCDTGERLWPDSKDGTLVAVDTPQEASDVKDFSDRLTARLSKLMADKVSKMFYKHEAETIRNRPSNIKGTE